MTILRMILCCFAGATATLLQAQSKRLVQPRDCVTVRNLSEEPFHPAIQIDPTSNLITYEVKAPNLQENVNDIQVYLAHLNGTRTRDPDLLLSGQRISGVRWLQDGRHLLALINDGSREVLVKIDAITRKREVILRADSDITEYVVDQEAKTIVYTVDEVPADSQFVPSAEQRSSGYRVAFHKDIAAEWQLPARKIYVTRLDNGGIWSKPQLVTIISPFSNHVVEAFTFVSTAGLKLSLSPDGKLLLISYITKDALPEEWREGKAKRKTFEAGLPTSIIVLHDLSTGRTTIPFETYLPMNTPLWSRDSTSFVMTAISPVNSRWEQEDLLNPSESVHLFWVEPVKGKVELVLSHVANGAEQPLNWQPDGNLMIHSSANRIVELIRQDGKWVENSSFDIPLENFFRFAQLASDGKVIVGDYQNTATPPELFSYRPNERTVTMIARLNPQFDKLTLAPMETLTWRTSQGVEITGTLLKPPDYVAGKRYPMVIQANLDHDQFLCDSGLTSYPSFAPQPIADSGIMYLMRTHPEGEGEHDVENYLKGYPGRIGEAAFHMDIWDSAIGALDAKGLIDRDRVGIIGFSRYGWYTEFILAHSQNHFKAATATDNVQYSLSGYWLGGEMAIPGYDAIYDGPPYGDSLKNWLKYSVSFNLDKFRTPLLMEVMGYGDRSQNTETVPNLTFFDEIFTGLNRLGRPVELYYYPTENHQPDHPKARLATLQRNLDWYRYWLQGYERPDPEDPEQYSRWQRFQKTLPATMLK
jgi:dipeptidyl aminopeptidase/acylaminoacyl peptidase